MKLGMYIMAPENYSKAYIINPPVNLCAYLHSLILVRKQLGKKVTAATNAHANIEEFFRGDVFCVVRVELRKAEDWFFPEVCFITNLACILMMRHEYTDAFSFHFDYFYNNFLIRMVCIFVFA
jgi:hypothetical protein